MPIYIYEHPNGKEQIEVVQRMTEEHAYSKDGVQWKRVFALPAAKIDSFDNMDPFDRHAFIKRTATKGMTVGDMWDESSKLSEKRAKKVGKDFVKVNTENDYKFRTGKSHPFAEKPKLKHIEIS